MMATKGNEARRKDRLMFATNLGWFILHGNIIIAYISELGNQNMPSYLERPGILSSLFRNDICHPAKPIRTR